MAQQGDFIGFSFGGVHSSELEIVRVSDGSRFSEGLLPTFQDKTATVSGKDGTYYFGSDYTQKEFVIDFAFDHLTETQLRKLKQVFSTKKPQPLIFDEQPYKYYMVKIGSSATVQHLCFDADGARIYRGEGSINFIAYYPFARSVHKYLDEFKEATEDELIIYPDTITADAENKYHGMSAYDVLNLGGRILKDDEGNLLYYNKDEWAKSTGMKETQGNYDKANLNGNLLTIPVYNAGDLPTDFRLYLKTDTKTGDYYNLPTIEAIRLLENDLVISELTIKQFPPLKLARNDAGICIDTSAHLIKGVDSVNKLTTNLYNNKIQSGYFFKIPAQTGNLKIQVECSDIGSWTTANIANYSAIEYDYLYY